MRSNPFIKNRNGIAIWIELLLHRHELSYVLSLACRQAFLKRFFDSSVVVPVFYTDHPSCLARVFALLTLLYDAPVERLRRPVPHRHYLMGKNIPSHSPVGTANYMRAVNVMGKPDQQYRKR